MPKSTHKLLRCCTSPSSSPSEVRPLKFAHLEARQQLLLLLLKRCQLRRLPLY